MNQHYLELKLFLAEVQKDPSVVINEKLRVFPSEGRLYEVQSKVNHRLKSHNIYQSLFNRCRELNSSDLNSLLIVGATKMKDKLCSYAQKQLRGGEYWDPDPRIRNILSQIKPSYDIVESILGLNDYLTTAIPNLHQMSRSALVQVKKKKTLSWLSEIPKKDQLKVIDLAVTQRHSVLKSYKHEEEQTQVS